MIYCVEDDSSIRELIIYTLRSSGFEAEGFEEGKTFWTTMKTHQPELIMLDIMLPGEDGISILKKLKGLERTADIPVIMTTAKGTEYDKVLGLDTGADDYLVKPFGMVEMVSRVKALLRRTRPKNSTDELKFEGIIMNLKRHQVQVGAGNVVLTLKEYELLRLFLENPGLVMTRDQLLLHVWGTDYIGESRTVDVHIGTLRTKLGKAGEAIKTVRGVGYKLEASNE